MEGLNAFDVGFIGVAVVLFVVGLAKGLIRLLVGAAALVAAFLLAAGTHAAAGETIAGFVPVPESVAGVLGYVAVFLGTMLAAALVLPLARGLVRAAMLGWLDRLAGAAVGVGGAVVLAGSVVLPMMAYAPAAEGVLRESALAPYLTVGADMAVVLVPDEVAVVYRERMDSVRGYWRDRMAAAQRARRPSPAVPGARPSGPLPPRLPW